MIGRTRQILSRFPAHFEAPRPGKVLAEVVDALAQDLDVMAARLAAVRRAHRLGEAEEVVDLLRIGALHGITAGEVELLFLRFRRARELAGELQEADAASRGAAAEALIDLWSVSALRPRLPLYAAPPALSGQPVDPDAPRTRLLAHVATSLRYGRLADALRTRIARICAIHASGNGTVQAVMTGAANALDLDIGPIVHSDDRYWHAARVRDRLLLDRPVLKPGEDDEPDTEVAVGFDVAEELIGLEENPLWRETTDNTGRAHGESWVVIRRGFERSLTEIRVTGVQGGRTIGPMVVNRDEGRGIGFAGTVPPGQTLVFTEEGRALLDGADVTPSAYSWEGGCFSAALAPGDADPKTEFFFDGPGLPPEKRPAVFVTTTPADALDREAVYPHGDVTLTVPGVAIGVTRFAFFVQEAHFNAGDGGAARLVTPRTRAALFDGSLFAPVAPEAHPVAAQVALSWIEHRAFSARLLIPARFRRLSDDPEGAEVKRRIALALERFRPVGVELTVEFIDDRWTLGGGVLTEGESADDLARLRSATVLWEAPAD